MSSTQIQNPENGSSQEREMTAPQEQIPSEKLTDSNTNEEQIQSMSKTFSRFRWIVICGCLYITCILFGLDTTIAADTQGPIVEAFGQVDKLTWIGAGFPLGSVCVILILGSLCDAFDIKWIFIITFITFEVGSTLCGAAPNMDTLIVGRVITGAGGQGIYISALMYFTLMTSEAERGLYMALMAAGWGIGAVLGPIIGGAFAVSTATWRWAYYINLVIGGSLVPAFIFALPSISLAKEKSVVKRLAAIDFVGFILGAGVWISFLVVLTMAGGQWPWKDGRTIATFVAFGVVLALYIIQQRFAILTSKENRAFPVHLRKRTQVLLCICTAAGTTTLFVVVYYIPIYFQFVDNDNAIVAAVRLLPFVVIAIAANLSSGALLPVLPYYQMIYIIAGIFLVAGGGPMMTVVNPSSSTGVIYGLTILVAVGAGLSMVIGYAIATVTLSPKDAAAGVKMQNLAQIGAQVIALAVTGQIYQSTAARKLTVILAGSGFSAEEIQSGAAGVTSALFEKLTGELRDRAVRAVAESMETAFVLVPLSGAIMLLAALAMKREKLNNNTDRDIE